MFTQALAMIGSDDDQRFFEGAATLKLVEQHADEALQLADYGYVLAVGRVRAEGSGETLRDDPAVRHSYLGKPQES